MYIYIFFFSDTLNTFLLTVSDARYHNDASVAVTGICVTWLFMPLVYVVHPVCCYSLSQIPRYYTVLKCLVLVGSWLQEVSEPLQYFLLTVSLIMSDKWLQDWKSEVDFEKGRTRVVNQN